MRNLEITTVKQVKTRAIDFIMERDNSKGTQSVVLHPVKLYKNCFKPIKNSFFVLCNAQYSNEDFDRKIVEENNAKEHHEQIPKNNFMTLKQRENALAELITDMELYHINNLAN